MMIKIYSKGFGLSEFYFTRIYSVNGIRYHISVLNPSTMSHHFTMEKNCNAWKFTNRELLPQWILTQEETLSEEINRMEG